MIKEIKEIEYNSYKSIIMEKIYIQYKMFSSIYTNRGECLQTFPENEFNLFIGSDKTVTFENTYTNCLIKNFTFYYDVILH